MANDLLIGLLFAANRETFESLKPHMRRVDLDGTEVVTLDIGGLLKTKTDYRDNDKIDRLALESMTRRLQ